MVKEAPKSTSEESTQESAGVKENFAREIQELKAKGPLSPQEQARLNSLELALPYLKSENVSSSEPIMVTEEKASTPADTPLTESERSDGLEKQKDATAEYAGARAKMPGGIDPTDYRSTGEKIISTEKPPVTEKEREEIKEKPSAVTPGEELPVRKARVAEKMEFQNNTSGIIPEQGPAEIGPESREAPGLSGKERLFAYRMWSGDWKATEVPKEKDKQTPEAIEGEAKEVFKLRGNELDAYEKVCRTRSALKKLEKIRGGEKDSGAKAREKIEKEKELLDAENKYNTAKDAYEKRLDRFKLDLLNDFIKSNEEKYPGLTKEQLAGAALKWQHQSLLETIQNLDGNTRLLEQEREKNAREIGMLRNMWENFNQMPQWQKVAIGAAAAGVIGAGMVLGGSMLLPLFGFAAPGSVAALSVGGVAIERKIIGGTLGAGLQAAVDKLFISKKYGKERGKVSEEEQEKTLGHLNTELKDHLGNWVEDEEKKLKMMEIVDKDAKEYRARLDDITRREGKVRGWSALATGLIGGGSVLAYENWDNIVNLFHGAPKGSVIGLMERPKAEEAVFGAGVAEPSSVETAQEMNYIPSEPSSVETAQDMETNVGAVIEPSSVETAKETGVVPGIESGAMEPSSVETAQEMGAVAALDSKFAGKVYTVTEGDSLWSITRKMVKDGLVSEDQWKDGWQNSMAELANGKKVPLSEMGLIHAGDQVKILEEGGKISFAVEDYPHDTLKLSDNQGYYEYLKNAGKTPPKWLEDAVAMKSGAKSALEAQGAELHELVLSSTSEVAEGAVAGEPLLFPEALRTQYLEEFSGVSLARQEEILAEIASQRETINSLEGAAWADPEQARHFVRSGADALDFENSLRTSEVYLANVEALGTHLKEHGVSPYFFNRVKDVTVGEFIALSKGEMTFADSHFGYLQNQFRLYPDKWQKIASFLELNQPGRPEKMLILEKFVKKLIG